MVAVPILYCRRFSDDGHYQAIIVNLTQDKEIKACVLACVPIPQETLQIMVDKLYRNQDEITFRT